MEEMLLTLREIRDLLSQLNDLAECLIECNQNGLAEVVRVVEEIKGNSGRNLTDVVSKLDQIDIDFSMIDASISSKY